MIGRAAKLERLGLAEQVGPARWTLKPGLEPALRDLGIRGDIIKTMHRAMTGAGHEPDVTGFALHGDQPAEPVLGRLVERGLHDELEGHRLCHHRRRRRAHPPSHLLRPGDDRRRQARRDRRGAGLRRRRQAASACRSPPDRISRSRRRSRRPARPGSTASFSRRSSSLSGGGFGAEVREAMDRGSIISSRRVWPAGRDSGSSSRAISSTPCAGASSTRPPPNSQPTRGSPIALRRRRARLGHLSPARHARVRPVRHDRRWARVPARALAAGAGAATRPPCQRRDHARRKRRLEFRAEAGNRALSESGELSCDAFSLRGTRPLRQIFGRTRKATVAPSAAFPGTAPRLPGPKPSSPD